MGTLLDSFQSYGATRSRPPVPQTAVSGKRDSSSVATVWAILIFFRLETIGQKSSVKPESLPRLHKTPLYYVKLHISIVASSKPKKPSKW